MTGFKKKYLGDRAFYAMLFSVALPIMIQNGISMFVSLLDNVMVGRLGTVEMSGVAIANQLIFVFSLCIFGGMSGASIYSSQFFGAGDEEGVRRAFRFKLWVALAVTIVASLIFILFKKPLIGLYLKGKGSPEDITETAMLAGKYIVVMLGGLIPFSISQAYASTMRETGDAINPMRASLAAVLVNLAFNYILIYGPFGLPAFGVAGAAAATVLSRFVELGVVCFYAHRNSASHRFFKGIYKTLKIPAKLIINITLKGTPLFLNELLWSIGVAYINQLLSIKGFDVVGAVNITSTVTNLFNVVFMAFAIALSIIVGKLLGAGEYDEAVSVNTKLIVFSVISSTAIGCVLVGMSPLLPFIYKTTDAIRQMSTSFLLISGFCMPLYAFATASYFTVRSGGKTWLTFILDSVYLWVIRIPFTAALVYFTKIDIIMLFLLCQLIDIVKCGISYALVAKKIWVNRLV